MGAKALGKKKMRGPRLKGLNLRFLSPAPTITRKGLDGDKLPVIIFLEIFETALEIFIAYFHCAGFQISATAHYIY